MSVKYWLHYRNDANGVVKSTTVSYVGTVTRSGTMGVKLLTPKFTLTDDITQVATKIRTKRFKILGVIVKMEIKGTASSSYFGSPAQIQMGTFVTTESYQIPTLEGTHGGSFPAPIWLVKHGDSYPNTFDLSSPYNIPLYTGTKYWCSLCDTPSPSEFENSPISSINKPSTWIGKFIPLDLTLEVPDLLPMGLPPSYDVPYELDIFIGQIPSIWLMMNSHTNGVPQVNFNLNYTVQYLYQDLVE